jgi:hypothetical protein
MSELSSKAMTPLDYRLAAREFAAAQMKTQPKFPAADEPYIEAVIAEAAAFEQPIPNLDIAINRMGNYVITIKGYSKIVDDVLWVNTFMGRDRDDMLSRVSGTGTHFASKSKVVYMEKTQFHNVSEPSSLPPVTRRVGKRTE